MLRYLTAGESHGPALVTLVEGLPAGVPVDVAAIDLDLARRQSGYGRGGRMKIEKDQARVLSGIRHGKSLGSPVTLMVENRDWVNWTEVMSPTPVAEYSDVRAPQKVRTRPRPGHADLVGALKYDHADLRNVLERASARETTMRVAAGALAKQLLAPFGITVVSHVVSIGGVTAAAPDPAWSAAEVRERAEASEVRCADPVASAAMIAEIDAAKRDGDSLGGVVAVIATGLPPGLGSHVQYDRKLDAALGGALLSIQAAKGVEFGPAFENATRRGSQVHDEIGWSPAQGYYRLSNRAGGLEGGMTTGMDLTVRVAFKPISTLYKPLRSVEIDTHAEAAAEIERSDACAIPAAAVIAECVTAFELARFLVEKFGGDSLREMLANYESYRRQVAAR
ncbi:MAG: chorismate synthase [Symbiobacteriaceae bacterium]|jgi:chorismate synthase|nr:chorismate synthase [Symbiobacteriaceae bacterium]